METTGADGQAMEAHEGKGAKLDELGAEAKKGKVDPPPWVGTLKERVQTTHGSRATEVKKRQSFKARLRSAWNDLKGAFQ